MPNLATRLLAGESEIDWRSVDRARANLASCFLVGRTEDVVRAGTPTGVALAPVLAR